MIIVTVGLKDRIISHFIWGVDLELKTEGNKARKIWGIKLSEVKKMVYVMCWILLPTLKHYVQNLEQPVY